MRECARTSRVGVVVLSPYYVSKKWPLEELQIMRQAGNVLPLFYHLDPDECKACVYCVCVRCVVWCVHSSLRTCVRASVRACVHVCVRACVHA